nr:tumor necrosis factor receptor superfamily member 13C [Vicugna pacos]
MGFGSMRRGARGLRGRDGPAPTQCLQTQCFDVLVRNCVACSLLRTPEPRPGKSRPLGRLSTGHPWRGKRVLSQRPPPCQSLRHGLHLPQDLGGLALALVLVGLVSWRHRRRRLRAAAAPETPEAPGGDEPLDNVTILSPGTLDVTAPIWLPPSEDPATTPPAHSIPVPATELGSTELVTTKTAGPEQQ